MIETDDHEIINDPRKLSYSESAATHIVFRMIVTGLALCLIVLGKKNLVRG